MSVLIVEQGGRGGVADYVDALSTALMGQSWHAEIFTAHDHRYRSVEGRDVVGKVRYVRESGSVSRAIRRMRLGRIVNGILHAGVVPWITARARKAQITHLQGAEWPPLLALTALAARAARKPVILTLHNTFERGRSFDRSRRLANTLVSRIIVHSEADLAALEPRIRRKAIVIPHGHYTHLADRARIPDPSEARRRLGIPEDSLVVLLFGQLRPDKGLGDLLVAAARTPNVFVLVAGEDWGALAPQTDLLHDEALAGRVLVREGFLAMDEAAEVFSACDVVVLPYAQASASGVLFVAYGFARPVVAYPVGGLVEYVHDGETGWLTLDATAESLASTFRDLQSVDRGELRRRGEAGAELAEREFSWDAIAKRTIDVYIASIRESDSGGSDG